MEQVERTFFSRACGMDIRIDKNEDGRLTAYKAFPFSGLTVFAMRGDKETVIKRFNVSGSICSWLESRGHITGRWEALASRVGNQMFRYQVTPDGRAYADDLTYDPDGRSECIVRIEPVRFARIVFERRDD